MVNSWGTAVKAVHIRGRQSREKYIQSPMLSQSINVRLYGVIKQETTIHIFTARKP
jgi:hypothetical protein